jgi:hypothetical protein
MSRNEYWAKPKIVREQAVMFATISAPWFGESGSRMALGLPELEPEKLVRALARWRALCQDALMSELPEADLPRLPA